MTHPIQNQIGTVFIPVSNIEKARDWYSDVLGLKTVGEIQFGHLYVVPMEGAGIVLDSKIYSEDHIYKTPAFHLNTKDIKEAFQFMKKKGVNVTTEIEHDHYFNFQDPDGNMLMICKC
ncbi:putative enzyme related to lactoylglutathione lyase [Oceanobacillus picturae]|uniref:Enzyme related to lactoylglutathione lyase n=1 Tax=Oceanobacillus picturae TaxID=171693 RepID=W9AKA7_9BACI|nr:VOC family protein [Oceanobacillus picturae]CDO03352.1 putative enzyme related to lactoylglutathione lyase [Oceanobacillus picturae]